MERGLVRQRRNLMVVSTILILFDFAAIDILKVGFAGTEFVVGKPVVIVAFVWVLWGYFLLRYYQYHRSDSNNLRMALDTVLKRRLTNFAIHRAEKIVNPVEFVPLREGVLKWRIEERRYTASGDSNYVADAYVVPIFTLVRIHVSSYIDVLVRSTLATDFVLPYVLAFAAPVIALTSWAGT